MLDLSTAEVHVWLMPASNADDVAHLLDDDERARASRFAFAHSAQLYTAAHGALRLLLGAYLGADPAALVFAATENGKPYLAEHAQLAFNLAHSGRLAAVAVGMERDIGVDIEERRPIKREPALARRVMTPGELERYLALGEEPRAEYFLTVWARKEALLKVSGEGIRVRLSAFPSEPADSDGRRVVDLELTGYAAAVAGTGEPWRTTVRDVRSMR